MSDPAQHLEYATAGGYRYKSIDLEDHSDMNLMLRCARRYDVPAELNDRAVELVREHLLNKNDPEHAIYIGHLNAINRLNQQDDHKALDVALHKSSQPTHLTQVNIIAPDGASVDYRSMIARVRGVLAAQRAETD